MIFPPVQNYVDGRRLLNILRESLMFFFIIYMFLESIGHEEVVLIPASSSSSNLSWNRTLVSPQGGSRKNRDVAK